MILEAVMPVLPHSPLSFVFVTLGRKHSCSTPIGGSAFEAVIYSVNSQQSSGRSTSLFCVAALLVSVLGINLWLLWQDLTPLKLLVTINLFTLILFRLLTDWSQSHQSQCQRQFYVKISQGQCYIMIIPFFSYIDCYSVDWLVTVTYSYF